MSPKVSFSFLTCIQGPGNCQRSISSGVHVLDALLLRGHELFVGKAVPGYRFSDLGFKQLAGLEPPMDQ